MVGKLGTTELVLVKSPELPMDLLQSGAENSCPYTPIPHLCKATESWQIAITFWNNEKKKGILINSIYLDKWCLMNPG